jgi:hypothetical protein
VLPVTDTLSPLLNFDGTVRAVPFYLSMNQPVLALGWKELNVMPRILYYGDDVQLGTDAVNAAIEKGWQSGKVVRNWNLNPVFEKQAAK